MYLLTNGKRAQCARAFKEREDASGAIEVSQKARLVALDDEDCRPLWDCIASLE
jgi:hypothetical protein